MRFRKFKFYTHLIFELRQLELVSFNHRITFCQIPLSDIGQTKVTFEIDILQQNTINVTTAVAIVTSIGKLVSDLFIQGPGVHYLLVNTCFDTAGGVCQCQCLNPISVRMLASMLKGKGPGVTKYVNIKNECTLSTCPFQQLLLPYLFLCALTL